MNYSPQKSGLESVKKKVNELLELCQCNQIPMFVAIATGEKDGKTEYYNQMFGAKAHGISLNEDKIQKHILVSNGFSVVPPRDSLELDMSAVLTDF